MPSPGVPVSLVPGSTAADRRALKDVKTANGAPAITNGSLGFHTQGRRWLHLGIRLPDAATSIKWRLFVWDTVAGQWCLDTRSGTDGVVDLASGDTDNPQWNVLEIAGAERVYVQISDMVGAFTSGVNIWLSSSGVGEGG